MVKGYLIIINWKLKITCLHYPDMLFLRGVDIPVSSLSVFWCECLLQIESMKSA